MSRSSIAVSTVASLLALACSFRTKERVVSPADLAEPSRTRITNFLSAPVRAGSPSEETPAAVSRAAVMDEAVISRLAPGEVCFDTVVRTHVGLDMPLSEWRVEVNGQTAYFGDETISVRDYSYSGERDVLVAEAATASVFAGLRITEPTENTYRVMERHGSVCAPITARPEKLSLSLVLPQDDSAGNWGEVFVWKLR